MGPKSETYRDDDLSDQITNGGHEVYRTDITDKDGEVYSSRGSSESSQERASEKYNADSDDD